LVAGHDQTDFASKKYAQAQLRHARRSGGCRRPFSFVETSVTDAQPSAGC
jgi:hypothetical protein